MTARADVASRWGSPVPTECSVQRSNRGQRQGKLPRTLTVFVGSTAHLQATAEDPRRRPLVTLIGPEESTRRAIRARTAATGLWNAIPNRSPPIDKGNRRVFAIADATISSWRATAAWIASGFVSQRGADPSMSRRRGTSPCPMAELPRGIPPYSRQRCYRGRRSSGPAHGRSGDDSMGGQPRSAPRRTAPRQNAPVEWVLLNALNEADRREVLSACHEESSPVVSRVP